MRSTPPQQGGTGIGNLDFSPSQSPFQTHPYDANNISNDQQAQAATLASSISRISPLILLVIIVLAVIFFLYGLIHLVLWLLMKTPAPQSSSSLYNNSNRFQESTRGRALQRQLQHLFRVHDSGLEQSLIDSLPLFCYQDLLGTKEPFDCAVCLCEFSDEDRLRLVPVCSHAFHRNCLDTWLMSNPTCPLCRATLSSSSLENEAPSVVSNLFEEENVCSHGQGPVIEQEQVVGKRVFSVRLGKFRNNGVKELESGSSSSCSLDGRRCYSMGSYQYVVRDSILQLVLSHSPHGDVSENGDVDGGRIGNSRRRGESFSVSKIWLWSNKSRYLSSNVEISGLTQPDKIV